MEKLHAFDGALQRTVRLCNMYFILLDLMDIQPRAHASRGEKREREIKRKGGNKEREEEHEKTANRGREQALLNEHLKYIVRNSEFK